jgi:hypothetical protein
MIFCTEILKNPKIQMEMQKPQIAKATLSKKEQYWWCHNTFLQIILHSHSNKIRMGLTQNRHIEQ